MTEGLDWDDLRETAVWRSASFEDIVRELDIAWVAQAKLGVELTENVGRLVGRCPFHDDERASFAIFWVGDGKARWGCWSCPDPRGGVGTHGDVIDLVARAKNVRGIAVLGYARYWLQEYNAAGRPSSAVSVVAREDRPRELDEGVRVWYETSRNDAQTANALVHFAFSRRWVWLQDPEVAAHVVSMFALGYDAASSCLIAPHFDSSDSLVGLKHRPIYGTSPWKAVWGSRLREWYFSPSIMYVHHPGITLIVEGETDCWAADVAFAAPKHLVDVLALPAGVSSARAIPLEMLAKASRIVIAFDGDDAGRAAATGLSVRIAGELGRAAYALSVPQGQDIASLGPAWLKAQL